MANDWKFDPWANFNRIASPAWQMWHYLTPSDPFGKRGTAEYGRLNNGVFYDSPAINGFTLRFSGTPELHRELGDTRHPVSAVLEYGQGALSAMSAYERNSIGDRNTFFAGKYSLGAVAVMAAYDDSRELACDGKSRSATLSATYRVSPAITLKTGYGRQRLYANTIRFASFGADDAFSKRSTLYASLGRKSNAQTSFGVGMSHSY